MPPALSPVVAHLLLVRSICVCMITIANCYDIQEALRLQMALQAADIPSFIPDEATAQNAPYFFVGSGAGVRLQVDEARPCRGTADYSRDERAATLKI